MEALHPRPYELADGIEQVMSLGWTHSEEDELFHGIRFYLDNMHIKNADKFHQMIVEVANFLTLILLKKANVGVIRLKLRHLCDTYRHFKKFLFEMPGVSFNLHTNQAKVGPKYWRCIGQETELYAYFRIHGFRLYSSCWYVFDCKGLDQYASYIDEAVHKIIPIGLDPWGLNEFYYFRSRARYPRLNKKERTMRYRDGKVDKDNLNTYFWSNGWDPTEEGEFLVLVSDFVKDRNINSEEKYDILVDDLVQFYCDPTDFQVTDAGIREKLRSTAYEYQLFKRFLFQTVGVEYNFYNFFARVDDTYWDCNGKEPQYNGWFRCNGFVEYQICYNLFEVKGLLRFAYGKHPIDPGMIEGLDLSHMVDEDVFKSYYRTG